LQENLDQEKAMAKRVEALAKAIGKDVKAAHQDLTGARRLGAWRETTPHRRNEQRKGQGDVSGLWLRGAERAPWR
jgi:hypothetical protein